MRIFLFSMVSTLCLIIGMHSGYARWHSNGGQTVLLPPVEDTRPEAVAMVQRTLPNDLERLAVDASIHFDLPPWLVLNVIFYESSWNPAAVSHAGAVGLMQIIPESAGVDVMEALYGVRGVPKADALLDPELNIVFGAKYLHLLYHRHFGHVEDETLRWGLTLAAYNWGVGNVRRHLVADSPDAFFANLMAHAPAETQRYVLVVGGQI